MQSSVNNINTAANPLIASDQDRVSPLKSVQYTTTSTTSTTRDENTEIYQLRELLLDLTPNSLKQRLKN